MHAGEESAPLYIGVNGHGGPAAQASPGFRVINYDFPYRLRK